MAFTDYYVDLADGGTGSAGSQGDPFSWADLSARMITGGAAAPGDRYYIRGTVTMSATVTWTRQGSQSSPIVFQGVDSSWGVLTSNTRNQTTGILDTTNFPVINTGGYTVICQSVSFATWKNITVSSSSYNGGAVRCGGEQLFWRCKFANAGTGAAAAGIATGTTVGPVLVDCDAELTGASGGLGAFVFSIASTKAYGCRVLGSQAAGFYSTVNDVLYHGCICEPVSGTAFQHVGVAYLPAIINCTIYGGGVTVNGISLSDSSHDRQLLVVNTIITGCTNGINNLRIATSPLGLTLVNCALYNTNNVVGFSGASSNGWLEATNWGAVTPTDAESEFMNAASGDYRLKNSAKCRGAGLGPFMDIGALQRREPVDRPDTGIMGM
jgi:hypothetical protein